jgi:hypothetical protein
MSERMMRRSDSGSMRLSGKKKSNLMRTSLERRKMMRSQESP